jgi:hypothetical protein
MKFLVIANYYFSVVQIILLFKYKLVRILNNFFVRKSRFSIFAPQIIQLITEFMYAGQFAIIFLALHDSEMYKNNHSI